MAITFLETSKRKRGYNNHAFTIIEVLVVIAILGILAGIALFGSQKAFQTFQRVECQSNLRQVHMAFSGYLLDDNRSRYPDVDDVEDWGAPPYLRTALLPYLGNPAVMICPEDPFDMITGWLPNPPAGSWRQTQNSSYNWRGTIMNDNGTPNDRKDDFEVPKASLKNCVSTSIPTPEVIILAGDAFGGWHDNETIQTNKMVNVLFCDGHVDFMLETRSRQLQLQDVTVAW